MRVYALLPHDRTQEGVLWATDDAGPILGRVRCKGKADNQHAIDHGNPTRDPLKPYGDTPLGVFRMGPVEWGKAPAHSYGAVFIRLSPVSGPAWEARQNGRAGLGAHGGDLAPDGHSLRPTDGCPRLLNEDASALGRLVDAELAAGRDVFLQVDEQA